jgi:hypothetical protein
MIVDREWNKILMGFGYQISYSGLHMDGTVDTPSYRDPQRKHLFKLPDKNDLIFLFTLLDNFECYTITKNENFLIDELIDKNGECVHCSTCFSTLQSAIQYALLIYVGSKDDK